MQTSILKIYGEKSPRLGQILGSHFSNISDVNWGNQKFARPFFTTKADLLTEQI